MKVKELIKKVKEFDGELEVVAYHVLQQHGAIEIYE